MPNVNTIFSGKILILVPHMDDEILACGGTIAQLANKEIIYVIFITDGRGKPFHKGMSEVDLNEIRTNESKAALNILGLNEKNIKFLNFPDGHLKDNFNSLVSKLHVIINDTRPDYVFIPFRYDWHPDHITLNRASTSVYANLNFKITPVEYFVYTKWHLLKKKDIRKYINPDLLISIDISAVKDLKRQALDCFKSQITNYFENQTRPVLKNELLEKNCNSPEIFLETDTAQLENVFFGSQLWISFISLLEPILKNRKDKILYSFQRLRKNFTFHESC